MQIAPLNPETDTTSSVRDQRKLPSLIEVLKVRRTTQCKSDGFKVAVVIEGGSMRGVVAGGMISALQALGLSHVFDVATGTSAGAIAASYLLADQSSLGPRIYYEDLTDRRWLNFLRPVIGRPLLDFNYLFDKVLDGTKRLNTRATLDSNTRLLITATRKSDWTSVVLEPETADEVMLALQASCRIPLVGGSAVKIDGEEYVDGSITVSIPFAIAIQEAPTHVLILLTHPDGESIKRPEGLPRAGVLQLVDMLYPGLGKVHAYRPDRYLRELRAIRLAQSPQVMTIRPDQDESVVGLLEQDAQALYAGARSGAKAVFKALGTLPSNQELDRLLHKPGGVYDVDDRHHT